MIANGATAEDAAAAQDFLTGGLRNTLRQAGLTEGEIRDLIRTYGRVPDDVMTELDADSTPARREIGSAVGYAVANWANRTFTANIGANVGSAIAAIQSIGTAAGSINIPGNAAGGPVAGGRVTLVGEKGPELFVPDSDGRIIPNHQLGGGSGGTMIGGGGGGGVVNNYEVNVTVGGMAFATPDDFAAVIAPTVARELGYLERNR